MDKGLAKITAGELRDMGFEIPIHIPDCAVTEFPYLSLGEISIDDADPSLVHFNYNASFLEPFTWVEGTLISRKGSDT